MWLMIEALDVWMVRDGKPFDSGAGHVASSLFPPTAFTLQGMLRSLAINRSGLNWDDYARGADSALKAQIGDPLAEEPADQLGAFWMRGPYLARREDSGIVRYFPLPADVVQRGNQLHVLRNSADLALKDELPDPPLWLAEDKFTTLYRSGGQFSPSQCVQEADLFVREERFGNAIDAATRTVRADEGMLYSASFIRPCSETGLLVQIPDAAPWETVFPQIGAVEYAKLGGEGRAARIERIDFSANVEMRSAQDALKLILITPAYFVQGVPTFTGITARALGRASPLGGWDLAKRRPRPIRRYAPPGSVFIAEAGSELPELLTEQPVGELPLAVLGFGEYLRLSIKS